MKFIQPKHLLVLCLVALAGCAGASVSQQSQLAPASNLHPTQIVIYPFAVDPNEITLNQGIVQRAYRSVAGTVEDEKQSDIADDISQSVCLNVATDLAGKGYNAVCQKRGVAPFGDNVLIVDGEFNNVSEGNRLRRMAIGLGAGASTLDTNVYVVQRSRGTSQQLMQFSTHADSGKMPGALVTGAPGAAAGGSAAIASLGVNAAMGAAKAHKSSMGSLADMTADQIVDHLTRYFSQQGWNGNVATANP